MGYGQFPDGKYFDKKGSSIMFWMKPLSIAHSQKIISFISSLVFKFTDKGMIKLFKRETNVTLPLGLWSHLTVTASSDRNPKRIFYFNGIQRYSDDKEFNDIENIDNYLGGIDSQSFIIFDELKIFNRILSSEDILKEKEILQPYKIKQV